MYIYIDTHTFTIKDSRTLVRPLLGSYREHPGLQYRLGGNRWEHKTGLDRTLCIYIYIYIYIYNAWIRVVYIYIYNMYDNIIT